MKLNEGLIWGFVVTLICLSWLLKDANGQGGDADVKEIVATGGTFAVSKSVVAGGGHDSGQGAIFQNGTVGQIAVRTRSTGGQFTLYPGFWTPDDLVPTSMNATVSGRVLTIDGHGIAKAKVIIAPSNGLARTIMTGTFGYFAFNDIPVGETYVISVSSKRFSFSQPSQILRIEGDLTDIEFVGYVLVN